MTPLPFERKPSVFRAVLALAFFMFSTAVVFSSDYYEGTVLLVDAPNGALGILWTNEDTDQKEKLSFTVDPKTVDVTNQLNHNLQFSDIQAGDSVDVYCETDKEGRLVVTEVVDYNRFESV